MAISFIFFLLMAAILLGVLGAIVFALVYAIANKRPGVAAAAILIPIAALIGISVVGSVVGFWASYEPHAPVATVVDTVGVPPFPPQPPQPESTNQVSVDPDVFIYLVLIVFCIAVTFALIRWMNNRQRESTPCQRRVGWMWFAIPMIAILLPLLWIKARAQQHANYSRQQAAVEMLNVSLLIHERIKVDPEAQKVLDDVAQRHGGLNHQSMQEAWEQLNRPRIDLTADERNSNTNAQVDAQADAAIASAISDSESQSLARSIARLERAANQVANVAEQVSDLGTLVGRAMVLVNNSISSRPEAAAPTPKPVPVIAVAKAVEVETPVVIETSFEPAADAPAWIDDPPKRVGKIWREVLITDEFATAEECARAADLLLVRATFDHLQTLSGESVAGSPFRVVPATIVDEQGHVISDEAQSAANYLARMGLGIDYIRREIAKDEYTETVQRSFGPMKKTYTLLEFSPNVDQELRARWEEHLRRERFATVGLGAGSVLSLVGLAYGLLKVDTWTKGYYSKRLFLGVPAAIIGVLGLLLFAA